LRLTPEVRFLHDDAVDRGERVLSLIAGLRDEEGLEGEEESSEHEAEDAEIGKSLEDVGSSSGFFELEALGLADGNDGDSDSKTQKKENPFLEGVDEEDFDDMPATSTFFSADMFPDAQPALEMAKIKEKQSDWKGSGSKAAIGRRKRIVQKKR
jgi:hypothetical protein